MKKIGSLGSMHLCSLLLLTMAFVSPSLSSTIDDDLRQVGYDFPSVQAKKLIRELNLFPHGDINIVRSGNSSVEPKIVEKRFSFPYVVDSESGVSLEDLGNHAVYYNIDHSHAARMFYFFLGSRNSKKDPIVIWLTGGPGCSSELALFYENGPFKITDNLSLVWNDYGWDKGFFAEHPEYAENDFYITGESYAGHYIPAFAARIHMGNKTKEGIDINLKGFAIGNGLTDPAVQYKAYTDYALDMGIIQKADYDQINKVMVPACEFAVKLCGADGKISCMASYFICNTIFSAILSHAGDTNPYSFSGYAGDWMSNLEANIPALIEDGISLLVYAGEYDLICNWLGNSRWVHAMEWSGQKEFVASREVPFVVDGSEAGMLKSYGPLSFLKVHDAGHMDPMDQPKASLEMLKKWIHGSLSQFGNDEAKLVAEI